MTTNQSLTNAFNYTFKSSLKGLSLLPALANFGVLAFFVTFFTGAEILQRQPIINNEEMTDKEKITTLKKMIKNYDPLEY